MLPSVFVRCAESRVIPTRDRAAADRARSSRAHRAVPENRMDTDACGGTLRMQEGLVGPVAERRRSRIFIVKVSKFFPKKILAEIYSPHAEDGWSDWKTAGPGNEASDPPGSKRDFQGEYRPFTDPNRISVGLPSWEGGELHSRRVRERVLPTRAPDPPLGRTIEIESIGIESKGRARERDHQVDAASAASADDAPVIASSWWGSQGSEASTATVPVADDVPRTPSDAAASGGVLASGRGLRDARRSRCRPRSGRSGARPAARRRA